MYIKIPVPSKNSKSTKIKKKFDSTNDHTFFMSSKSFFKLHKVLCANFSVR